MGKEQIEIFMLQDAYPYYLKHHSEVKAEIFKNKEDYARMIVEAVDMMCKKIRLAQEQGRKKSIQSIHLSTLYTSFWLKHGKFMVEAYDERGYQDLEAIELSYSMMPYIESLILFKEELLKKSNRHVMIKPQLKEEIEKLTLTYFAQYSYYFIQLARYALDDVLALESFRELTKTDNFRFIVGEYHDSGEIIDATKNTYKNNEKALTHLEYINDQKAIGLCQKGLEVQNKDYTYYDFRNSIFNDGCFKDVKLDKTLLSNFSLKSSSLQNVSMKGAILHDACLNKAVLNTISMDYVYADVRNVEGLPIQPGCIGIQCMESSWEKLNCINSTLYGANFRNARFTECLFEKSDLSYCDFRGATFDNVSFKETSLNECLFDPAGLEMLSLTESQRQEIKRYTL
ncbi:pentapeptide repeat-containing protein [Wukongibacter baidiensis]|uniref:pentapeptide repeat-containing protein n=1 Tax=Wukongibacter baidiensis TaxID=1723361 RepID=UPI003D7FAFC4